MERKGSSLYTLASEVFFFQERDVFDWRMEVKDFVGECLAQRVFGKVKVS